MAAVDTARTIAVPGLHVAPTLNDLGESSNAYNQLLDDEDQPEVPQHHLDNLIRLFARYNAQTKFGLHLIHRHLKIDQDKIMLGTHFAEPAGCWTKPTDMKEIDPANVHGHIFLLAPDGHLVAYEYREGPPSDMAHVNPAFFVDLVEYLQINHLATLLGLQVLQESSKPMVEFVLQDTGTVMLCDSDASYGKIHRVTGWSAGGEDGIVSVQGQERHAKTIRGAHHIWTGSKPLPTVEALKDVLREELVI